MFNRQTILCSLTALFAMTLFLFAAPELRAGDGTIPLEPTTDQSIIDEAIFLVEQVDCDEI